MAIASSRMLLLAAALAAMPCAAQDTADTPAGEDTAAAGTSGSPLALDSSALPQAAWAAGAHLDSAPTAPEPRVPADSIRAAEAPDEDIAAPPARPQRTRPADPLNTSVLGLRLSFFYYHELFPERELLEDYNVDRIDGEPKSAEYGVCEGIHLEAVRRVRHTDVFLRPKLDAVLGLLHKYDGSTHPAIVRDGADTVAVFSAIDGVKNNYFLNGGLDIGVGFLRGARGCALWSGIGGRLWRRRLWDDDEYYYWFSLPLGFRGWVPAGPRWTVGLELSVEFMLGGWMRLVLGAEGGQEAPTVPAVRLSDGVPFGRRASLNLGLPLELRAGPHASVRFTPWFEYYHFERSNNEKLPDGGWFYEPASRTFIWGVATDIVIHRPQRP